MFFFYQIILILLFLISPLIIIFRIIKNKEDKKRFIEKFSIPTKKRIKGKLLWFHGASVGEILSIIPLIKNYEKKKSINQILITSSTLSSSKVLKKYNFKKTVHQFYPIDQLFLVNKFLKYWKPSLAVFIESEIWPCMFLNIYKKKIPLVLLNARLTKKTFNRWIKIKTFSDNIFSKIKIALPQNLETKYFLKNLNIKKIKYTGNLKFVESHKINSDKINNNLKLELNKKKIWVASSTHLSEEIFCAKAHLILKKKIKNLMTIIIPRHIHRAEDIVAEIKDLGLRVCLHSSKKKNLKNIDIYIVDTFGETRKFHEIASTVFLGGSIIKRGGQNPLEAARCGAKILHGSNTDNFKDIYQYLKSVNISKKIITPNNLATEIVFKKNKRIGRKIKIIGDKILKQTINELDNLI
tara:strand:+ start:153 stop:1382 length:1230 start_codon:yes stop_codon:yes gene_type:complete